ncbi:MAG: hypothetical protein LUD14_04660 [Clostridiales bacterium]|nr:hypothetical protein [Clostridiales bacterium]
MVVKIMITALVALYALIVFPLYCCLCAASAEDDWMERMRAKGQTSDTGGEG